MRMEHGSPDDGPPRAIPPEDPLGSLGVPWDPGDRFEIKKINKIFELSIIIDLVYIVLTETEKILF